MSNQRANQYVQQYVIYICWRKNFRYRKSYRDSPTFIKCSKIFDQILPAYSIKKKKKKECKSM